MKLVKTEVVDKRLIPGLTAETYELSPETGKLILAWEAAKDVKDQKTDLRTAQQALDKAADEKCEAVTKV